MMEKQGVVDERTPETPMKCSKDCRCAGEKAAAAASEPVFGPDSHLTSRLADVARAASKPGR